MNVRVDKWANRCNINECENTTLLPRGIDCENGSQGYKEMERAVKEVREKKKSK